MSILFIRFGCAFMGKVRVFEKRNAQLYVGFELIVLAAMLIVLVVEFPHG